MISFVYFKNEPLFPVTVEMFLLNVCEVLNLEFIRVSGKYEAGDGNSSTIFLGIKWSFLLDFVNEVPFAIYWTRLNFKINLFFI